MTDTALKVSASLYCLHITSISHGVEISPGCGVRASLMLFYIIMLFPLTSILQLINFIAS